MISTRVRKRRSANVNLYAKFALKIILFMIFVTVLFSMVTKFKSYFPIKSVKVFGVQHVDQEAMQQVLTPLVNKGFFAIDVETIKDRLLQSPWVSKAIVQRVWPDKILITVVEKAPTARWNNTSLLSNNGEIFSPDVKSYPSHLPLFVGPEGKHIHMLQYYKKLSSLLTPLHFKIARFELTPERTWRLTLDNGVKLSVGYKDVLTRMNHFVKVYPKIIGNRVADVDYVDLRYSNGLAVRWKTVT
ncbi:MAG: cell division protein FtsQ/DivIB [Gammaproteobacteria bacterium]